MLNALHEQKGNNPNENKTKQSKMHHTISMESEV